MASPILFRTGMICLFLLPPAVGLWKPTSGLALIETALTGGFAVLALYLSRQRDRIQRKQVLTEVSRNLLMEHSADCAVVMNLEGTTRHITLRGRHAIKSHAAQPSWIDWWLPEMRSSAESMITKVRQGETLSLELAMGDPEQNILWWEVTLALIPGNDEYPSELIAVMQNATAKREVQQQLKESEERFSAFFENAPAMVYIKDHDGRYLFTNTIYERLRGNVPTGLIGRTDRDALGSEFTPAIEELEKTVLRKQAPRRALEAWNLANGDQLHWRVLRFPLRLSSGKLLLGTIGLDVTRTVQAESQLEAARDLAIQSAKLKSEFLANMSHEIRTPMNGIIGMAGLLMDSSLGPRDFEFVKTISNSADALLKILNDVLDFSKIEAGMLVFEEIDFDVESLLYETAALFGEQAANKNLNLAVVIAPETPAKLRGDPGRLRQILINLIGNALKFTNAGEVVINCAPKDSLSHEKDSSQATLLFTVRDTGIGISPETQNILFKAFNQADGSTTRRYGGTGLGLAISKELALKMSGQIGVKSSPEEGSSFWFTAQFERLSVEDFETIERPLSLFSFTIFEPHAATRQGLALGLSKRGAHVIEIPNVLQFLSWAGQYQPDVHHRNIVILDHQFLQHPDAQKSLKSLSTLGVQICLTGPFNRSALTETETSIGCSLLLNKPFPPLLLSNWVLQRPVADLQLKESMNRQRSHLNHSYEFIVAEDNEVNQTVIRHQLNKLGHKIVFVAETGVSLLNCLSHYRADAILMDCQMPEMDGYSATTAIRGLEVGGNAPWGAHPLWIIAMTANTMEGDREKCLSYGMSDYLSKPVKEIDLAAAIARIPKITADLNEGVDQIEGPIEIDALKRLAELGEPNGRELLMDLIDTFVMTSGRLLEEVESGLKTADFERIKRSAHALAGSALNFGAHPFVALCNRLQLSADSEHSKDCEDTSKLLSIAYKHLEAALLDALTTSFRIP